MTGLLFAGMPFLALFILLFNHFTKSETVDIAQSDNRESIDNTDNYPVIDATIPPQYKIEEAPIMVNFNDTTNKKQIAIPLDRLYYITSAQNYIEIFYRNQNGKLSKQLLRNTLKTVEEELSSNANLPLVRCHKGFIVNYDKVLEMQGNAKNAYFILMDTDTQVPVSRHKYADFQGKNQLESKIF